MKKCLVIYNTFKEESKKIAVEVSSFLKDRNVSYELWEFSGENRHFKCKKLDFVITLGGDGTVLYAARQCAPHAIPVFPINLGEFGFIAGISPFVWQKRLDLFLESKEIITERSLVHGSVLRGNKEIFKAEALNDIVVSAKDATHLAYMDVACNDNPFGIFKADGIIVSTSTGSTAYSAAAGGPIIDPGLDTLILNPLSPLSLSNRPLVLAPSVELKITMLPSRGEEFVVTWDGQVMYVLKEADVILIKKAEKKVLLVGCDQASFYTALRSKLHWSGGPRA